MAMLQMKITLKGVSPPVWRRFMVQDNITFHKLHEIIQEVMGWGNYHLYEFDVKKFRIGLPDEDIEDMTDSKKLRISALKMEGLKITYCYDFGDNWEHSILVEKITEESGCCPECIAGKRACPPEDCGGPYGYEELLEIRKNPKHPDYKHLIVDWLGRDFDPEAFDVKKVNSRIGKVKMGRFSA
jgi:hypothetical protein